MNKYSPGHGSPKSTKRSLRVFLKSPLAFYLVLIGVSFGAGYLARSLTEYWRLYSRLRNAAGHDSTVKHVNVKHSISAPTNSEEGPLIVPDHFPNVHAQSVNEKSKPVILQEGTRPKTPCHKCDLGLCNEPDPAIFTEVSTEIQLFMSMRFPCSGVVTQWKLIDYNPTPGKIVYIDVIRYTNASDQATWMGFNTITTTGEAGWVTYDVPKSDQLTVERDWLVAIHYDDLNADGVIPHSEDPKSGLHLYDGFGILLDHQEIKRLDVLRKPSRIPISAALKQLLVELHQSWRAPALAAILNNSTP